MESAAWLGIVLCVLQSGTFSGLNLAMFGPSALTLEASAAAGNADAERLLGLRRDSNFLLTTILWGNVGTNVLLTLLSDSVLAGVAGFVFSTFLITFGGEIIPQAYFSRHALRMATLMRPLLRLWQFILYPLAKPTALILDAWLGPEGLDFMKEAELRQALKRYIASPDSEISRVEGIGALNFLTLDDLSVLEEGESIDPTSVIELSDPNGRLPTFEPRLKDPFLMKIATSGCKWVVLTSPEGEPLLVLDANAFLSDVFARRRVDPERHVHEPIVVRDANESLGDVLPLLRTDRSRVGDDVIHEDVILVWGNERRVITGADLLGRLLRGIARPRQVERP